MLKLFIYILKILYHTLRSDLVITSSNATQLIVYKRDHIKILIQGFYILLQEFICIYIYITCIARNTNIREYLG